MIPDENIGDVTKFRSMLNSASFLRKTRYDILYVLKELSQVQNSPTTQAWKEIDRLYRYLACTIGYGLAFSRNPHLSMVPVTYSDSDWAGCPLTRRSTGGAITLVQGNPIAAYSKNQTIVTDSSNYAETYEVARATRQLLSIMYLLQELGSLDLHNLPELAPLYVDNKAVLDAAIRSGASSSTRHYAIKTRFFEQYLDNLIRLVPIGSSANIADIFTKALPGSKFISLAQKFMTNRRDVQFYAPDQPRPYFDSTNSLMFFPAA